MKISPINKLNRSQEKVLGTVDLHIIDAIFFIF